MCFINVFCCIAPHSDIGHVLHLFIISKDVFEIFLNSRGVVNKEGSKYVAK